MITVISPSQCHYTKSFVLQQYKVEYLFVLALFL
jgi:hypothetical protein